MKIARVIMFSALLLGLLAGCAPATPAAQPAPTQAPAAAPTQAPTVAPTEAPAASPTQAPSLAATQAPAGAATEAPTTAAAQATSAGQTAGQQFKVAVVMPSAINDLAFSQSMYEALVAVQKELGKDKFDFAYTDNVVNVDDAAAAVRDYASKGYNLVIAHGSQYGSFLPGIAKDFPKTSFAWGTTVDTFTSQGVKNVFAYEARSEQGGYVNGVMAAKLTKAGIIGVVGPVETGDAKLYVEGFQAGVTATNPQAKVNVNWIGTFSDVAKASAAAQTQVKAGADVLTGSSQAMAGTIGVAKDANVLYFGTQADQSSLAPQVVVASQVYDWTGVLKQMMSLIDGGTLGGQSFSATLANGGEVITFSPQAKIPADVQTLAESTIKGIADGTIKVTVP